MYRFPHPGHAYRGGRRVTVHHQGGRRSPHVGRAILYVDLFVQLKVNALNGMGLPVLITAGRIGLYARPSRSALRRGVLRVSSAGEMNAAPARPSPPVRARPCTAGQITLNIPFRHLMSKSTIVEVDDVWMVLKPNAEFTYDDKKARSPCSPAPTPGPLARPRRPGGCVRTPP